MSDIRPWSRLMSGPTAAAYLGIGRGLFDQAVAPLLRPVHINTRKLYDINDLDRYVDSLHNESRSFAEEALENL